MLSSKLSFSYQFLIYVWDMGRCENFMTHLHTWLSSSHTPIFPPNHLYVIQKRTHLQFPCIPIFFISLHFLCSFKSTHCYLIFHYFSAFFSLVSKITQTASPFDHSLSKDKNSWRKIASATPIFTPMHTNFQNPIQKFYM